MMQQTFIYARDSHVTAPEEIRRLSGQNAAILARLRQGPATARDLCAIAINYRARLSDIRKAGYHIPAPVEDRGSGMSVYRIVE